MIVEKRKNGWLHKCDVCGNEFTGRKNRRFCSVSCSISNNDANRHSCGEANPNWRGGTRKRYKREHPDRVRANWIVSERYRHGKLSPKPCVLCGNIDSQAHHQDYSKPLEITWLCPSCHSNVHFAVREIKELAHAG